MNMTGCGPAEQRILPRGIRQRRRLGRMGMFCHKVSLQLPGERLVQQGLLEFVQGGEFAGVEGFEALGLDLN